MEQVIEAFGIDSRLIAIQIFNFILLAVLLWYFLYAPILKILNDRQSKIAKGLEDADRAQKALEQTDADRKVVLEEAHTNAEAIVARAKDAATIKADEIVAGAEQKAVALLESAEQKGEEIKNVAKKESEAEIARLALLAAEKLLRKEQN